MSSEKELTPEEKLLALIQQDKRQDAAGSARPVDAKVSPSAPVPAPAPVPSRPAAVAAPVPPAPAAIVPPAPAAAVPAPAAEAGSKLKLAASPAVAPARTPVTPAAASPVKPAEPAVAPSPAPVAPPVAVPPAKVPRVAPPALMTWPLLNRILALVVLVLLVVVVYSVASIRSDVDKALAKQVDQAGALPVHAAGVEAVTPPPVGDYLQKVSARDIFRLAESSGPASNAAPAAVEFKLLGVSVDGRDPKGSMAILKSKASAQTFFVKVGDALGNTGFTLDRVLADRAILKNRKEEIEVR